MNKLGAQELLLKYRLGRCTKEQLEIIECWYNSFDFEKQDLMFLDPEDLNSVREEMFRNIMMNITMAEESPEKPTEGKPDIEDAKSPKDNPGC